MVGEFLERAKCLITHFTCEDRVHLRLSHFFLGSAPRDDLFLADDVGVVLRDLHVLRHVGQRLERLTAPHACKEKTMPH